MGGRRRGSDPRRHPGQAVAAPRPRVGGGLKPPPTEALPPYLPLAAARNWASPGLTAGRGLKQSEPGEDTQYGLTVYEMGKDGWNGSTMMMVTPDGSQEARQKYIAQQRDGFLLYKK